MTNKIFVENIRKIAKTNEILKKIPNNLATQDKSRILGSRGVALADQAFSPCQLFYTSNDGVYTFANLIDGVDGPKIQDGNYNKCDQVNTITGMKEIDHSPTLTMKLKPDGIFLPVNDVYMYTSFPIIDLYNTNPELFDTTNKWAFASAQEAYDFYSAYLISIVGGTPIIHELITTTVTSGDIGIYNFQTTYPIYAAIWETTTPSVYGHYIVGIPLAYDFSIDTEGLATSPPYVDLPFPGSFSDSEVTFGGFASDNPVAYSDFQGAQFQLALLSPSRKWETDGINVNNPLKYINGVSIVMFNFGPSFTRTGMVHPAKDGGFLLVETSSGMPIGNVYIYRQDRTLANIVPAAQIEIYYP